MDEDKLEICPCDKQSDACYTQTTPANGGNIKNYFCYKCGFLTNTLMKENQEFFQEQIKLLPDLYKDLIWKDSKDQCWMPSTITIPSKCMIFMEGKSIETANWSVVLAVEVKEEEKHKFPIPGKTDEFYKHRMDFSTLKKFDRYDFIGALEYANILPQ